MMGVNQLYIYIYSFRRQPFSVVVSLMVNMRNCSALGRYDVRFHLCYEKITEQRTYPYMRETLHYTFPKKILFLFCVGPWLVWFSSYIYFLLHILSLESLSSFCFIAILPSLIIYLPCCRIEFQSLVDYFNPGFSSCRSFLGRRGCS